MGYPLEYIRRNIPSIYSQLLAWGVGRFGGTSFGGLELRLDVRIGVIISRSCAGSLGYPLFLPLFSLLLFAYMHNHIEMW